MSQLREQIIELLEDLRSETVGPTDEDGDVIYEEPRLSQHQDQLADEIIFKLKRGDVV